MLLTERLYGGRKQAALALQMTKADLDDLGRISNDPTILHGRHVGKSQGPHRIANRIRGKYLRASGASHDRPLRSEDPYLTLLSDVPVMYAAFRTAYTCQRDAGLLCCLPQR